ncbi:MAG TPA: carboxypeptidase regulatory-like domain-containing protein [Thermoanaerobaculia bacterium]|nr:carboxypeptidase regulatory-like domain-containing protein [Thermoanaerobaculia bacterium]
MRSRLGVAVASALALAAPGPLLAGTLSGRVVAPDGGPVAGAPVSWYAARTPDEVRADATAGASPKPIGRTRTDAEGRFEALVDPAGPSVRFRIEPAGLPWAALDGPYDPSETTRLPDVALPAAAPLSGLVAGSDGKAIAGARVVVRDAPGAGRDDIDVFAEATTGADGAFRVANAPASARLLWVRAAGWAPAMRLWREAPDTIRVTLERGGVITGTVVDAGGRAIPGALVRAADVAAVTDAQGTYRLEGVSAGLQSVEASAAKNLVARRGGVRVAAGAPASADLVLQPGASISGSVVDAVTRRPIAGARIAVGPPHVSFSPSLDPSAYARADARGHFTASGLLPGDYEVRAEKTGYLPASLPRVAARSTAAAPASLALTPAASIAGRVVDAQGKPVPGAAVTLEPSRGGRGRFAAFAAGSRGPRAGMTARTGPDGSFRLDGLPAITSGAPLVATHAGYAPAERPGVTLKPGQTLANVVLVLPAGLSVKGRVVDAASQPVSGAEIRVAPSQGQGRGPGRFLRPPAAPSTPNAVSAADGTFTVAGLAAGAYDVTASHDGFSPRTAAALPAPAKLPTGWPPIVLARGAAITGVVHDDQGAPIPGASVSALGEGLDPRQTNTDGSGAFRLDDLVKGRPLMLAANAPGYGFTSRSVTAPAEGITVVLGKTGTIRGRVVDAATGAPVTTFSVGASPAARGRRGPGVFGGAPSQAQYSEDGTFEVTVAPGTWNVRAAADGYRPADIANLDVDAGQTKEGVEIALKRGGGLTGHVTDTRGNPVSGASIACCDAASARPGAAFGGDGSGPTATSDGDGHFALDGLPDGHATLTVTHPDYVTTSRDVDPAATADVVIQVSSGAEISGTVVSSDAGQAVPGASVTLNPEGDSGTAVGASQTAQSDGGGGFRFDHLTAGRYRLTAQTKTASSTPQDLVVADGQPMDGVRVAVATGVEVDGAVTGLPAGQLGGVNISASATGFNGSAVTADDGTFTLTSVPEGVLRVTASTSMPSVRTVAKTIETSADQSPMSVELAFQGASRLSGQVTRGGQPLSQFSITAVPNPPDGSGRRYTAMSDGSGRYDIENMTDGSYDVTVIGTDNPYRTTIAVSGDTNGDIAMPAATISGIVTDSASGAPLEGATVQAQTGAEATSQAIKRATTDSTGAYSLSGLDPGDYQVSARKDGYQLKTQALTLGGDPATLDLALDPGAGLSILAGDGLTGMPLGGIIAIAFGAGGTIAFQGSVALDATGAGQIPSLPPGQYAVYFFSSGYAGRAMPSVTVPSAPVRVTLTPGGSVQARASAATAGRIVDASGNPVLLSPNRLDGSVTVAPPVSVWQHLAPGSYSFLVPSGTSDTAYPFTVVEGQSTTLALP